MSTTEQARSFCDDTMGYYGHSLTRLMSQPDAEREEIQLAALKYRFQQLRESVQMVKKLADNEGVAEIKTFNDVVPLLFDHTMYKSYPVSLLYEGQFVKLTRWLSKLTAIDLSDFDASDCHTLDDWLIALYDRTPLNVVSTSGTSGASSFLPRSKQNWHNFMQQYPVMLMQEFGKETPVEKFPLNMHAMYPYFRSGAGHLLLNELYVKYICGAEERFHAAYPGRLSPDVLLLTQRMRVAAAKGELDRLDISPEMKSKRDDFVKLMENRDEHIARFFDDIGRKLRGERVFMQAVPGMLHQMAKTGLARGDRGLFARNSLIVSGGGAKGAVLTEDWEETVKEFLGVDRVAVLYGMGEMLFYFVRCDHGRYHTSPGVIPFVLDPETSQPLPRTGTVTGRWAHYDLGVDAHWGGFITGDEVTMHWDDACPCGRKTPFLDQTIRRFSEISKGSDKITCAATQDAYDDAMDFLVGAEV